MIYAANDEGVAALNNLGTTLPEKSEEILKIADKMVSAADENAELLGVHAQDLKSALATIKQEISNAAGPVEELSEKVLDVADGYQEVIERKRFSGGSLGASGTSGAAGSSGASSAFGSGAGSSGGAGSASPGAAGAMAGAGAGSGAAGSGQIADHEFTRDEKIAWVQSVVPTASQADAERIVRSMEYYSGNGYVLIHWDKNGEMQETKDILQVFDSGNVSTYNGVIHRGLSFKSMRDLWSALADGHGNWNEPGITSFSASKDEAEKFAGRGKWGLLLTCTNNKSAIPFRHMSLSSNEEEVLSPGSHRNSGWKIDFSSIRFDLTKHMVYVDISEI